MSASNRLPFWRWIRALVYLGLGLFFFLLPGLRLVSDLNDPALKSGAIPQAAWRLHNSLAFKYAAWANGRLASNRAEQLGTAKASSTAFDPDVAGTEWPLFGSVFYLWSEESLQAAWEADPKQASVAPVVYAHEAIEAAANLVTDPRQAAWVQQYWGPNYLHHQNLFYRFLLISAMTSYTHLTGNPRFVEPLRDQVETLSAEIDASPHGLVEDYPGQCFPTDIIGAITAIRRADAVLQMDHSAFVNRAIRGFQPPQADAFGLPPYMAGIQSGLPRGGSRGCGTSFALICAPEIWPVVAKVWSKAYDTNFWQEHWGLVGFREYARDSPEAQFMGDVDSGPVLLEYGFAASAFGTGAARANGRMDEAGPLSAEMLVSSWPLPTGTLMIPRLLSSATDAPYLGEAGILYCLTRQPLIGITVMPCTSVMTPFVWGMMAIYLGVTAFLALPFLELICSAYRSNPKHGVKAQI